MRWWLPVVASGLATMSAFGEDARLRLDVDARDATRKVLHARMTIPAQAGTLTLYYPKWIPGSHGPYGPVPDLTGLQFKAGKETLKWRRDAEDMYAFHVEIPESATTIEAIYDFLLAAGDESTLSDSSVTAQLLVFNWNLVLLYPKGASLRETKVVATLRLPQGWKYGTAMPVTITTADGLEFAPVSLETLVDSPVLAGAHFKSINLLPGRAASQTVELAADSDAALDIPKETTAQLSRLMVEAGELFGSYHYHDYHFLMALSDHIFHFAIEHHESSDDRFPERGWVDDDQRTLNAYLLPHELVHSWNGKYRRPAGLATPDFQQPAKTELLWMYEGLTQYLGNMLTVRSGLWTNETYRQDLALAAARLDLRAGRTWRPLADTAVGAPLNWFSRSGGRAWRRSADYYHEGHLIWLEADVLLRQRTHGKKSLDDFCRGFFGGKSGPPEVVTYTFDDVVAALNRVETYDWRGFFESRVNAIAPRAPLGGIEGGGWKLVFTDKMPDTLKTSEAVNEFTDLIYSIGLTIGKDGAVDDVLPGLPADKAGISSGMKFIAVNGRRYSSELLRAAIKEAKSSPGAIELILENSEFFKTIKLDYHEGEKYPHLERDATKPDVLSQILKPLVAVPADTKRSSGS